MPVSTPGLYIKTLTASADRRPDPMSAPPCPDVLPPKPSTGSPGAAPRAVLYDGRRPGLSTVVLDGGCAGMDDLDVLASKWPESVRFTSHPERVEGNYASHAHLFASAFPGVGHDALRRLSLAARLFSTALIEIDRFVDGDEGSTARTLDLAAIQFECYRTLAMLFPGDSPVWLDLRDSLIGYARFVEVQAVFMQRVRPVQDLSYGEAVTMARGKTSVEGVTLAALGELAGTTEVAASLRRSLDDLLLAKCLVDDVRDWRGDAVAGRPSFVVAEGLRVAGITPGPAQDELNSAQLDQVGRSVYFGGVGRRVLDLALAAVARARVEVAELDVAAWMAQLDETETQARALLDQLPVQAPAGVALVQPAVLIRLSSDPSRPWQAIARHSLGWLLRQWRVGFPEAAHCMVFPRRVGGGETGQAPEEQIGDVFSRAVIAGCLVEADRSIAGAQLEALIAREVEHLLSRCRPGEAGLWSYFPDLPELPCDADDLAEVLHLLVSTGRAGGLRGQLDQALRVALYDGACPDGAFATWVIDQQDQSEVTAAQSRTARDRWGEGSDPEVVANLLSAVHLYDPDTHSQALARGASYLLDAQSADGSWHTGWYHGSLYGTYQCARALAAIRPEARQALDHATDFVLSTQHPDGGWSNTGPGGDSDPLGTALALLTLAQTLSAQEAAEHTETVERAGDRLRALANPDGSFAAVPFILMHPQRVPGRTTALSFGCASITTALVCRSAIAWDQPM